MLHKKPTSKSQSPNSGQKWGRTSNGIKISVSDAKNERNPQTNELHWRHLPFRIIQTSGFTPIFLAQWSQWTATKNLFSALQTLSPSTLWSLRLPTRKLKWWRMPFTEIGSPNSEFLLKYTLTEEKSSSINCRRNYFSYWMSGIQKRHQRIQCNAQVEVFNKTEKSFCNLLWTIQP